MLFGRELSIFAAGLIIRIRPDLCLAEQLVQLLRIHAEQQTQHDQQQHAPPAHGNGAGSDAAAVFQVVTLLGTFPTHVKNPVRKKQKRRGP